MNIPGSNPAGERFTVGIDLRLAGYRSGGIPRYGAELAEALTNLPGVHVQALRSRHDPTTRSADVRLRTPPHHRVERIALSAELLAFGRKLDIYHAIDFIVPRFLQTPAVATVHDLAFRDWPEHLDAASLAYYHQLATCRADTAAWIVPSKWTKSQLVPYLKIEPDLVHVIPHGLPRSFERMEILPRSKRGSFLLAVGTVEPRKRYDLALDALDLLPDPPEFVLVGATGWNADAIERRLRRTSYVTRYTDLNDQELRRRYLSAAAVLVPSYAEGFGFSTIEAMACGTPVISSNGGSLSEVNAGNALVPLDNQPESWRDAIQCLLDDADLWNRLSQAGINRAKHFSWAQTAASTAAVYRQVLAQRTPTARPARLFRTILASSQNGRERLISSSKSKVEGTHVAARGWPQSRQSIHSGSRSKLHVIVNPASGNGRARKRWPAIARVMEQRGFDFDVEFTAGPGDATALARKLALAGAETVIAVGGDGTVNEIINGLIEQDRLINPETRLAIIPCGTGKDISRSTGTQKAPVTLRAIELEAFTAIDIGKVEFTSSSTENIEQRYFANVADMGLGAAVAERINRSSKALGGLMSYLVNAVRTIKVFSGEEIQVEVDGLCVYGGRAQMVVFANGRYFAGGMHVAPDASLRDGLLDILILEDVGRRPLLTSILPRVYLGKHIGQPGVRHLQGQRARVESTHPLLIEMDGEQPGVTPVEISVLPQILPVFGTATILA